MQCQLHTEIVRAQNAKSSFLQIELLNLLYHL